MAVGDIYLNSYRSIMRLCTDIITDLASVNDDIGNPIACVFANVDAHANIHEWPNSDILGIVGFSMEIDQPFVIRVFFVVSTLNDDKLFRHSIIVNELVKRIAPWEMTKFNIPLLDHQSGDEIGTMTSMWGTSIRQMERTEDRPFQYIYASFAVAEQNSI